MLTVKTTTKGGAKHAAKATRDAAVAAALAVVDRWHERYLPGHFELAAARKYGYQPRKGDAEPPRVNVVKTAPSGQTYLKSISNPHYSWRKRREKGHNRPLVWSGNSEKAAKLHAKLSSVYSRKDKVVRAAAAMPFLATYFYQYRKDLGQPDKAAELTRTTADEVADLQSLFSSAFDARLAAAQAAPAAVTTTN